MALLLSSPEHYVIKVSFCGRQICRMLSVNIYLVDTLRVHISCSINLKFKLNLGHLGSKIRSLGQIEEITCRCSSGHISCSIDLKISQNVCLDQISNEFEFESPWIKN